MMVAQTLRGADHAEQMQCDTGHILRRIDAVCVSEHLLQRAAH